MSTVTTPDSKTTVVLPFGHRDFPIVVLLVDDQNIINEAVRRMIQDQPDITLHYCSDPTKALQMALDLHPTLILQDIVMPDIDGLTLVRYYRANSALKDIPVIVLSTKEEPIIKAEAFACGANDYLVKLPDRVELIARIRYHSSSYIRLLERDHAYKQLDESRQALQTQLTIAANYVTSLLPEPLSGEVSTAWRFVPSEMLGGDSFGYRWIDSDHLAFFVLDVCGHGVGAALLSVSAMEVLRGVTLKIDYTDPETVLEELNRIFPMENHNNMFFTISYCVYTKTNRKIVCATGGHPPPVIVRKQADGTKKLIVLEPPEGGLVIGAMPDAKFSVVANQIEKGDRLYIFSDGLYELTLPDKSIFPMAEYIKVFGEASQKEVTDIDRVISYSKEVVRGANFDDDVSLVEIVFN